MMPILRTYHTIMNAGEILMGVCGVQKYFMCHKIYARGSKIHSAAVDKLK